MAIWMMLIAALTGAGSNFSMRRSIDAGGSSKGFLIFQLSISTLMAFLLNPVRTGYFGFGIASLWLGLAAGLIVYGMMWSLGEAMEKGPPGLTLAALNSATVMPAIVMAIIFKSHYSLAHAVGSLLVVVGLFWAGRTSENGGNKRRWIKLMLMAFVLHVALLCILQWRVLMLTTEESQWFNPILFLTASICMFIYYIKRVKRLPKPIEGAWGTLGGLLNGTCIFLLVVAPEVASPTQNAMIFPLFAIVLIVINNFWGQALYKERVNWLANALCIAGVIIGTVNWAAF